MVTRRETLPRCAWPTRAEYSSQRSFVKSSRKTVKLKGWSNEPSAVEEGVWRSADGRFDPFPAVSNSRLARVVARTTRAQRTTLGIIRKTCPCARSRVLKVRAHPREFFGRTTHDLCEGVRSTYRERGGGGTTDRPPNSARRGPSGAIGGTGPSEPTFPSGQAGLPDTWNFQSPAISGDVIDCRHG